MGAAFALLGELFPTALIQLFMKTTPEVLEAAPAFVRSYFPSFLFLGYVVVTIYYLQSVLQKRAAALLSFLRAFALPEILLLALPSLFGLPGVYASLPVAEFLLAVLAFFFQRRIDRRG